MNCPFCEIVTNHTERVIRETANTFTVLSNPRLVPGHLLVIPKHHVQRFDELDPDVRMELFEEVIAVEEKVLANIASGCDISQHYRPFIPQGRLKVDHLHMHVRPREFADELYRKVQKYESEVFADIVSEDVSKYRKLLK